MAYQAVEEIQNRCEKESIPFWKAVQLEDCEENGITEEESWQQMTLMWTRMKEGVDAYNPSEISRSGLVGKEGGLMDEYRQNEKPLCGDFVSKVIANALKMGCNNACMKRIVAAPTAGACGVMPAVLVTYFREYGVEEGRMIEAMYVAAGSFRGNHDPGAVCGSRNRTSHCKPSISGWGIWWMSGRDRICIGNGCSGNMFGARWQ